MRPDDLLRLRRNQPFRPFRITLTGGQTYEVPHPDMMMVGQSTAAVGVRGIGTPEGIYDQVLVVALLHIVQAEPVNPSTQSTNGPG